MHGDEAQSPAVREDHRGAWHANAEVRLVRERGQGVACVEAAAAAPRLRHQHRVREPAGDAGTAQAAGKRGGQLLDAEQVGAVAVDQRDQGARVGGAEVDVGREHRERLVVLRPRDFATDRPRQDRRREVDRRDRGDRCRRPVAQRDGDARDQQRRDRGVGREPHQRGQPISTLQPEGADDRPEGNRDRRSPDRPVAPRARPLECLGAQARIFDDLRAEP